MKKERARRGDAQTALTRLTRRVLRRRIRVHTGKAAISFISYVALALGTAIFSRRGRAKSRPKKA